MAYTTPISAVPEPAVVVDAATSAKVKQVLQSTMKTGLTGHQVLVQAADAPRYESLIAEYQKQFQPVGPEETALVQSIIDLRWRIGRFPGLESALLDLGRRDVLKQQPALAGNPGPVLDMQVRLHYAKQFRDLRSEERSLSRRREREMQELVGLQTARKERETKPQSAGTPAAKAENGFEFSTSQLIQFLGTLTPEQQQNIMSEVIRLMPETGEPDKSQEAVA